MNLTPPSSGQPAGCALRLPLMSNVRHHVKINPEFVVYLVGIAPLAFFSQQIQALVDSGLLLLLLVVVYLLALRLLGRLVAKRLASRGPADDQPAS
jgi:hypothetical protein